ncbi:MAG: YncE family protein [Soonwooa sp.]
MKIKNLITGLFAVSLLSVTACKDDNDIIVEHGAYENGVLISAEGALNSNQAEVSFITSDLSKVSENIYSSTNAQNLGDVLQTIGAKDDKVYLVVNNSNKIEVVNRYSFKKMATISAEVNQPRDIAFSDNYIYVTNDKYLGDKYVAVYNASDFSFIKKISFTDAAQDIAVVDGKAFVQNASYGVGKNISVINTKTNNLDTTLSLPKGDIQKTIAYKNRVYTITSDGVDSYIYTIDATATIANTLRLTGVPYATNLVIDNDNYYFSSNNQVYAMPLSSSSPKLLFAASESPYGTLYGFNVIDGKIFTSNAGDFASPSEITVYSITGSKLKTFNGGIGVGGFYKN